MAKLLLDECIPHGLRADLVDLETYTVAYMGWSGLKNGELMRAAVKERFDVLLTVDKYLKHQQNMREYPITIVVFDVVRLELDYIRLLMPKFWQLLPEVEKHQIYVID